ncbi:heterokaryon incompatibility protein-domain-containing protein [Biscogniauxia sp. FL1348]|nr:heterokaryon incompatibility protein-domain-containing protein [Biscogniauxia sp. FL1348]
MFQCVWKENDFINTSLAPSTGSPETPSDNSPSTTSLSSSFFSPTRLLELQTPPPLPIPPHLRRYRRRKIVSPSFRLVDREEYPPNVKYVTLSHCWGPGPAHTKLRLVKNTESKLRKGLPVSILPRTFRDAFEIVARLGLRYLWIDRLCIVQDSAADWAAEAGTMLGVYRGGFLCIAALGSPDDEGGCFFERDVKIAAPMAISLSPPSSSVGTGNERKKRDSKLDFDDDPFAGKYYRLEEENEAWKVSFTGEPLLSRAWVLQERMLSRRTLYFGRLQVFWECVGAKFCETMPNGGLSEPPVSSRQSSRHAPEGSSPGSTTAPPLRRAGTWKRLLSSHEKGSFNPYLSWTMAVQTYSRCDLTFADDKLVALSGLAKQFAVMFSEEPPSTSDGEAGGAIEYAAGLWLHTMPKTLLWMPKSQGRRPASYRAPSWSWAAIDGEIQFASISKAPWYVEIKRVETVPRGADPMGALSGGTIELKGPLCILSGLKYRKPSTGEREAYTPTVYKHPETGALLDVEDKGAHLLFDTPEDYHDEVIFILFHSRTIKTFDTLEVRGLALALVDQDRPLYRRVGFATCRMVVDFSEGDNEREFMDQFPVNTIEII